MNKAVPTPWGAIAVLAATDTNWMTISITAMVCGIITNGG